MSPITAKDRVEIAESFGINEQFLYQCLTGRRDMDATAAAKLEVDSGGRVRRWHVRRDWHITWPELIGTEGAPDVPQEAGADEARIRAGSAA